MTPDEARQTLAGANTLGSLLSEEGVRLCVAAEALASLLSFRPPPAPECAADEQTLLLLGDHAPSYWRMRTTLGDRGMQEAALETPVYDWRAAQIASWSVPVACCVRCRGHEFGCLGLTERGTTHRQCWPEAFE